MRRASLEVTIRTESLAGATFSEAFNEANHELGAKVVAGLAGVNVRTLSGYGSDQAGTATFDAVTRAIVAQALLGNATVIEHMAAATGRGTFVVPRVSGKVTQSVMQELAKESEALSKQFHAITDAFADGSVSAAELAFVEEKTRVLMATAMNALALVRAHADAATSGERGEVVDDGGARARKGGSL